jgi:IS5 family transposase
MGDKQISFANVSFDVYAKSTKRAVFLSEMDRIVPWERLRKIVEPHYPRGEAGRPPIDLTLMRIHFVQQ